MDCERGLENGQASHRDIKKYYADSNNAINVSDPLPQESAQDYRERVLEELQTVQAAALRERTEKKIQREELDTILDNITDAEATRKKIAFYDQFQKQYQLLSKIDPSRARHLSDEIQYMSRLKDLTRNR